MRKPRRLVKGACYHVGARVNHQEFRLDDDETKQLLLDVIKRAKEKYPFKMKNFTIMSNHFHFIIQPVEQSNLSKIMQFILGVFAMAYNRIHGLKGHFWQGRFFSRVIESLRELIETFVYIDNNPVKTSQVMNPWEWVYGGLMHHRISRTDISEQLEAYLLLVLPIHQRLMIGYEPEVHPSP
ncbi:hypothetical protein MASR2M78_13440 [Treponema sp.]